MRHIREHILCLISRYRYLCKNRNIAEIISSDMYIILTNVKFHCTKRTPLKKLKPQNATRFCYEEELSIGS
jgi:hypothetical protein